MSNSSLGAASVALGLAAAACAVVIVVLGLSGRRPGWFREARLLAWVMMGASTAAVVVITGMRVRNSIARVTDRARRIAQAATIATIAAATAMPRKSAEIRTRSIPSGCIDTSAAPTAASVSPTPIDAAAAAPATVEARCAVTRRP